MPAAAIVDAMTPARRTVLIVLIAAIGLSGALVWQLNRPVEPATPAENDSAQTKKPAPPDPKTPKNGEEKPAKEKPKNPFLQPGPAILLLNAANGLKGRLDKHLVFHGTKVVKMGPVHSGPPLIDRTEVKKII